MKTNSKIKAFTVSEMVVVLILSSIVIGLAFSVLTLIQNHMTGIQYNFSKNTEINKLEQALYLDFNRYSEIEYNDLENTLEFKNELDYIEYRFEETKIIKGIDTFKVETQNMKVFFDGNQIQNGLVDSLKLETSETYQSQTVFVFKKNDATQFLN